MFWELVPKMFQANNWCGQFISYFRQTVSL